MKWIALGSLLLLLAGWGLVIEPRIVDVRRIDAAIPDLPQEWEGAEVAFISDAQLGIFFDNSVTFEKMVEGIVEEEPDLVLLGGDYVYSSSPDPAEQVEDTVEILHPLTAAGLPTFAVLGNHDIEQDVGDLIVRRFSQIGIPVLSNEAVALGGEQEDPLYLVGIGPLRPGLAEPMEALAQVPDRAPRLVLMHNPDTFPAFPPGSAPLALAGHTHGGQMRVPFFPQWSWLALVQGGEVTVDGWIDEDYGAPGNRLFVNRGIGMSVVPMRINCLPELTLITLRRA